jgi:hypothetical protein
VEAHVPGSDGVRVNGLSAASCSSMARTAWHARGAWAIAFVPTLSAAAALVGRLDHDRDPDGRFRVNEVFCIRTRARAGLLSLQPNRQHGSRVADTTQRSVIICDQHQLFSIEQDRNTVRRMGN